MEVRKSEVGSRKSEVGSRKSEVRSPKSEVRSPKSGECYCTPEVINLNKKLKIATDKSTVVQIYQNIGNSVK